MSVDVVDDEKNDNDDVENDDNDDVDNDDNDVDNAARNVTQWQCKR